MSSDDKYGRHLERRAEELGLPTDPEAYQDGGLAVAATASNLAEADTLAALLKSNDVPAWVKAPLATLWAGPDMFSVLVPLGRLTDARRLIAEHPPRASPPEEAVEAAEEAEEEPAEPAKPAPRRSAARIAASLIILGFGILEIILAVSNSILEITAWGLAEIMGVSLAGAIGVTACAIGILGLRRPRESSP